MTTKAKRMLHLNKCIKEVNSWTNSPMNSCDAAAYAMHNFKIAKAMD